MKEKQLVVSLITFTFGIFFGTFTQSYWQRPVITALASTVVAKESRIQEQDEDLLWYTQELVFAQDGISKLKEQQASNKMLIAEIEDFYKIDVMEARKGGPQKLDKLVAKRLKQYRGMGGN